MAKKPQNTAEKYAFIPLIVAAIACVSAVLVGLFKGAQGLGIFTPTNPNVWNIALEISVGLIVVGLAAYALMTPDTVRRFFSGRQARYGSNSLILSLAFIGILVVANYLAFKNPKTWDFTEDKSNTLAPETLQILATLPQKVHATAFYSANLPKDTADQLLKKFKTNSNGKFDYEFVDPDTNPVAAREAGVTGDGKILLTMGQQKEISSFASETELTRTMIRLVSPGARAVYFLQGHGEPTLDSGGDATNSFSTAKSTLESKNYTVNALNLAQDKKIPDDALAIVIAGPKKPITDQEASLLKDYVDKGGSLVVLEDPIQFTEFGTSPDPLANYLATDWGITLNNDVVIDLVNTQNPFEAVSSQYSTTHPITMNMTQKYIVILPEARSISIKNPENVTDTPIILTTDQSWGETNLVANETPKYDAETDFIGPLTLAAAGENSTTKGRVVVFGNSLFATDQFFNSYGNGNIFVNSVDWAAEQENIINITPREPIARTFQPPTSLGLVGILIFSVFLLPGAVVVAGISSWISRRRRG